jgi:hypothetical protein
MNKSKIFVIVFVLCLSFYGISRAENAPILEGVKTNGFVSTAYNHNLNDPDTRMVNYRPFNENAGSFNVDVAELVFQKEATEESNIGFRTDIMYGYTIPAAIHSAGVAQSNDFDIQQTYVRYIAPVGSGLTLDMGKFITEMGAEVIEGYDAWNYNYSRSLLFYYSIPFTHTGLRGTYKFNDMATLMGQVINGWDNVVDNNKGKSYCAHLMLMPVANTMLNLKYMTGPEQANNDSNIRNLINANLTLTLLESLTLNFDYVNGSEQKDPSNKVTTNGDSKWSGIAGIIRYVASDRYAINIRAETFSDSDGARTGVKQDMTEITVTPEFTVKKNMIIRPEFRHDVSDQKVFDKGANAASEKTQDTIAINMFFYF